MANHPLFTPVLPVLPVRKINKFNHYGSLIHIVDDPLEVKVPPGDKESPPFNR
jgi:hypothetical protein